VIRHLIDFTLTGINIFYIDYGIGFQLQRWALKIMSFVISAVKLFMLTQSRRLRNLLQGKFSVQVLTSPNTTPYRCDLSSETIGMALDAALAGTRYLSADWDEERESFIEQLQKGLRASEVVRQKPTVHAELALIMAMVKGEIDHVEPYIGVSKHSCIMCSHYIRAFNKVTKQKVATKGSHGKAYPGWFWPSLPSHDGELRPAFLGLVRQQLLGDFKHHAETMRYSDSSVGSGFPMLDIDPTHDEILELFKASLPTAE
jgi:OTT_1508-like deaminase